MNDAQVPRKQQTIERLGAFVSAAAAILLGLTQINDHLAKLREQLNLPVEWVVPLVIALSVIALFFGRRIVTSRSKLLRREAFLLRPDRADQLKGRRNDIERLMALCRDRVQVNLIGESGAGKSALIRGGILPRLLTDDFSLFPVYMNSWGHDWEEGPRTTLRQALLGIEALGNHPYLEAAAGAAEAAGRTLLIVFDQFDDYQSTHLERFRDAATRRFIGAGELMAANPFWEEIASLLRKGRIHCLFVTRADAAAGLESVRFVDPFVYQLDRLRRDSAIEVLEAITRSDDPARPVLAAETNGWPALRDRLVRDLSDDESVLAVQMSVALAGLSTLPFLTVREYDRSGGLRGLEAADIEWRAKNAARLASIRYPDALALLLAMVDREGRKTRPCTMDDLHRAVPGINRTALESVLEDWQTKDLLRRRLDIDTGNETWLLDHDYLSNGVLAAEARANRAATILRDAEYDYRTSGGSLIRRWRTLLDPRKQTGLFFQRLRGRFQYGERRGYALLSLLRFAPLLIVLLGASFEVRRQLDERDRNEAMTLIDKIGVGDNPDVDEGEIEAFWHVAESSPRARAHFITGALSTKGNVRQISLRIARAVHAAVGLDPRLRAQVVAAVEACLRNPDTDASTRHAALLCAIALRHDSYAVAEATLKSNRAVLSALSDYSDVDMDERDWQRLIASLTPAEADRLLEVALDAEHLRAMDVMPLCARASRQGLAAIVRKVDAATPLQALNVARILTSAPLTAAQREHVRQRVRAMFLPMSLSERIRANSLREWNLELVSRAETPAAYEEMGYLLLDVRYDSPVAIEAFEALPGPMPLALANGILRSKNPYTDISIVALAIKAVEDSHLDELMPAAGRWIDVNGLDSAAELLAELPPGSVAANRFSKEMERRLDAADESRLLPMIQGNLSGVPAPIRRKISARLDEFTHRADTSTDFLTAAAGVAVALGGTAEPFARRTAERLAQRVQVAPSPDDEWDPSELSGLGPAVEAASPYLSDKTRQQLRALALRQLEKASDADRFVSLLRILRFTDGDETLSPSTTQALLDLLNEDKGFVEMGVVRELVAFKGHLAPELVAAAVRQVLSADHAFVEKELVDHAAALTRRHPDRDMLVALAEQRLDTAIHSMSARVAAYLLLELQPGSLQAVVDVGKKPTCINVCLSSIVDRAEKLSGTKFDSDIWKFAEWAERNNLDVTSPARRQAISRPRPQTALARLLGW